MKKFNKNILVFLFFIVFVIAGIWGNCFEQLKWKSLDFAAALKHGKISSFFDYKYYVDDISNKELSYHDQMMDVNSLKDNLLGTRVVKKEDSTVVKADSGSLTDPVGKLDDVKIKEVVKAIYGLKKVSEENGANFLYCAAPSKELLEKAPANIKNYSKENYRLFLSELEKSDIPTVDFYNTVLENESKFNTYYYTDHHWTAKSGFFANNALLKELNLRYNFDFNKQFTDINNYKIVNYPRWFLGSKGKKVGTYFSFAGPDDFDLITPKFKTDMTEEQPIKNEIRKGEFKDTVLYMDNLKKNYYKINTYATYSGGDFRLQIMKNNLNPKGKKILIIRDSFAGVVTPFLALQTSELHICDVREADYYVGKKINTQDYIKKVKPDYVLVLYNSVCDIKHSAGKYDFFDSNTSLK